MNALAKVFALRVNVNVTIYLVEKHVSYLYVKMLAITTVHVCTKKAVMQLHVIVMMAGREKHVD
jgi:hypothetical protein